MELQKYAKSSYNNDVKQFNLATSTLYGAFCSDSKSNCQ